jgi:uncharacterized protein YndB with AHSA1/START domain
METKTQHGYLVLADISGFTAYLAATELDHAHEILSDLMNTIIKQLTSVLTLSKLEGDAVFVYAPETKIARGETLLELIEATYVAFRDRQTGMHRATTCTCNACRNINGLDLKFMAHHGDYILQSVAGLTEVIGSDVNLAHRLMKNHVSETTGWRAYALFTQKCLEHMGVQPEGWHPQVETYEHLGEVPTRSLDLQARHQELVEARRVFIKADEADMILTCEVAAQPPVVWEWMTDPRRKQLWSGEENKWRMGARPSGRTGIGSQNHCAHGKGEMVETVVDWRPFDYATLDKLDGSMLMKVTVQFEPLDDGQRTRVHEHWQFPTMKLPRWIKGPMVKLMWSKMFKYDESIALMKKLIAEEAQTREA